MDVAYFFKILGFIVSYTALLITLYKINEASRKRSVENRIKILNVEKDIEEIKANHLRDIDKFEKSIKGFMQDNREDHGKLTAQITEVGKGIAFIEGHLKGKK